MTKIPSLIDFKHIVFFTGAGMSAESGVPTYRGKGGIWKEYDYHSYACQEAFDRNPKGVWEFHNYRREIVGACKPNEGHLKIAAAEKKLPDVTVITQNIDGLHQLAGSRRVYELHGSLWRVRYGDKHITNRDIPFNALRPDGNWWRPDIIWFGDMLDENTLQNAIEAISSCDLLVSIGTSAVVYPAASLPLMAREKGATLIEINPEPTPISDAFDVCLRTTASDALDELCKGCSL